MKKRINFIPKYLMLGLLAVTIGVGSAIAGTKARLKTAWVSVLYYGSTNYVCVDTGFSCNEFGAVTCKIYVNTIIGPYIVPARGDAGCIYTLNEDSNLPIGIYNPSYGIILSAN